MSKLDRIREAMIRRINLNPYTIVTYIRPKVDNGYGKLIPDMTELPVETILGTASVSRRRLPDVAVTNPGTPYDYQDVHYLLAAYDTTWLHEGIVFEYHGDKFRTMRPEARIMFGGIAYWLCDLEQASTSDVGDLYG